MEALERSTESFSPEIVMPRKWPSIALFFVVVVSTVGADGMKPAPASAAEGTALDQAALDKQFAERLTSATLVGRFTIDGKAESAGGNDSAKPDRYEIERAEKQHGTRWVITSKFGKRDVKLPITIDVFWAGDTPVISLTNLTIPAVGTFTARVMIYGDLYAGTWQHGKVGGHMWGHIEHTSKTTPKNP
jgi:hypothetical protein